MSFTKTVFVVRQGDVLAGFYNVAKDDGRFWFQKELASGVLQTVTTAAALVADTKYQFATVHAVAGGPDITKYSPLFTKSQVKKVTAKAYAAGTAGTAVVTIAGTAPYIKLIDITDGREKFAMVTIEGTAAQIEAGIDAIGAKVGTQFYGVSASNASGVITVTFPLNRLLKVVANDESTLGAVTAPVYSVGTAAAVLADEKSALPFLGVTNIAGPNTKIPPYTVNPSHTYTKYTVMLEQEVGSQLHTHELVIYSNTNEAAAFDTIMETIFGVTLP